MGSTTQNSPVPQPLHAAAAFDLSIVMVNWNTRELMRDSLRSIYEHAGRASMEIIVVDNASQDGSVDMLQREFPQVIVERCSTNLGFARGCNVGVRRSRGRYILLINTDTVVHPGALDRLLAYMEAHPDVGATGPQLRYGDGTLQTSAAGSFPSLRTAFNYFFFLSNLFPRSRFFGGLFVSTVPAQPIEVDWVSSAVMLCRREALEAVGLVPEDYVCYMEDVLCCMRMWERDWKVAFIPDSVVIHYSGGASKVYLRPTTHNPWRSVTLFFYQQHGLLPTLALQGIALAGFLLRNLIYGVASLVPGFKAAKARFRRSVNLLVMTFWLTWEIITGKDWKTSIVPH